MALGAHLATLESTGLIRLAQLQPELEYLFRHALVQEAAYESLVKQDRKRLHLAVGEALERMYPDRLTSRELAPRLAQHFEAAGSDGRALKCYTLAGDAAAKVYANAEAVMHYARALELAQRGKADGSLIRHLYLSIGRALELSSQDAQALANYEEMAAAALARGDRSIELAALIARATVCLKPVSVRDPEKGRSLSERTLALARELGDRESEAKSLWNLMQFYKWTGQLAEALTHGEQALAIARQLNEREQLAYVLHDIASVYGASGQLQRALAAGDEAQRLWRELGILNMLADSLAGSAGFQVMGGEYERAIALSDEALRISQAIGNLWNQSYSWFMIDLAYMDRGEMGRAIEAAEECTRLAQPAGFVPGLVQSAFDLTLIYGNLGAVRRAYEVAERIRGVREGMPLVQLLDRVIAARLHLLSGRLAEAEAALDDARHGFPDETIPAFAAWFLGLVEAECALASGDYARVLALADEAIPLLRPAGIRLFFTDVLYFKGKALLALDRADEAYKVLTEARAEAEAIGSRRTLWMILAALSEIEKRRGNEVEAQSLRRQAREIVEFIADHAGSPDPSTGSGLDLRESFLNLPDVQNVMRETL